MPAVFLPHDGAGSFALWHAASLRRADRRAGLVWGASLLVVLGALAGAAWWVMRQPPTVMPMPEAPPAAIAIDLAPEPVATPMPPTDAPPGPMQSLSQPDPTPQPPPEISAPPSPALHPPVAVPRAEDRKPPPKKKRPTPPVRDAPPDRKPPAAATTAPPSLVAPPAAMQAAPMPGADPAHATHAVPTWQAALLARLEHYKRYPAQAQAGRQEGVAVLHFSMDRQGHVLSARIGHSAGHALLDEETLALLRRAEPLPVPPAEVKGDPVVLSVPVEFHLDEEQRQDRSFAVHGAG
ncbi:energy transducer TonB [Komagataeibacter sucrofermentans]|uniref:Energy transducer TonB n=1 Tax=Komagataeibacter sucrofermentans TaxID=1053551 RepID=A0A318R0U2_9PROT|nr:energy transducer TonB [Komagataeibacter sucrofermentans]PYD79153.1 energy transducer TonB [Komagataeibacter sucrofermentans]